MLPFPHSQDAAISENERSRREYPASSISVPRPGVVLQMVGEASGDVRLSALTATSAPRGHERGSRKRLSC